jgi:hypothetical protein
VGANSDRQQSLRRRWRAIAAATVGLQLSYWPVVIFTVTASEAGAQGALLAFGLALMPFVFVVLAFGSRHPDAPGAVAKAMALFVLVGVPVALLNTALGLAVGYASGGTVALRPAQPPAPRWRLAAVAAATAYVLLLLLAVPGLGLVSAALVPFTVLGLADQAAEARAANRTGAEGS